jgi:hypothetical protein
VDFLVTQSKSKTKCIDIGRLRHFVRKNRFIHGPELQNRLKTFNYDQQMLKRVRNGSFCHFSFFFSRNIIKGGTAAVPPGGGGTTLSPNPGRSISRTDGHHDTGVRRTCAN